MEIISACLCGINCKYNSKNNEINKYRKKLEEGKVLLVCPEQLGGLSTPRIPCEIIGSAKEVIEGTGKVIDKEGRDLTENFIKGANETLKIAKIINAKKAILKNGSPSCGVEKVYDGSFSGNKIKGIGITAYLLKINGIEVVTEDEEE